MTPVALAEVIGRERSVPPDLARLNAFDVAPGFLTYAAPLAGELPPAPVLLT
jgi:hypothetical protein